MIKPEEVLKKQEEIRKEKRRQRERIKLIKSVNGFYASTDRGAKIHMTKIKGRYL